MGDKGEFDDCKSLQELVGAIISLREMIDERFKPVPEVMTLEGAAAYLKVSERQMYRLSVEKGLIGYSQLTGDGSAIRFRKTDLEDYLIACRVPTTEEARSST